MMVGGNRNAWRETCPSPTLSNTNLYGLILGSNPDLRDERWANNHPGIAHTNIIIRKDNI
jgi:hypothetical protein